MPLQMICKQCGGVVLVTAIGEHSKWFTFHYTCAKCAQDIEEDINKAVEYCW